MQYTVYALTFAGLNYSSFRRSEAICANLDQMDNGSAVMSQTATIKT